ncbi:PQQ-dependent sugar dehydrogenase [Polyangium spumosum]|uniref:PQQ-dependent sugar dehydrogenase n=1 Tax=Polyangium spumosum TaxID=889282 RepID=A0A6N7PZ67_9BACT|nr:PQQ-dependent sugar dehydrogenase [Polyangium spumosum]MRG97512.1 PQQ-dependent sugar dehydrogenase [Polyangium spumosum]
MRSSWITRVTATAGTVFALVPHAFGQTQAIAAPEVVSSNSGALHVERLATLEFPWGMELLPDGRLLLTEKPGRLRIWANGALSEPVRGVPEVVYRGTSSEQGGLLDVAIDPDFARNRLVYLSYVEAAEQQPPSIGAIDDFRFGELDLTDDVLRGGAVARGRLVGDELRDVEVIWRQVPKTVGRGHFGHRLLFARDGSLFITSGDRMQFAPAQDLGSNLGKVVRIRPDGSIPEDNPFVGKDGARGDVWSYGHRNVLSAAIDPSSGRLWALEMGPLGGDELNLVEPGRNYGWPLVSNGDHYTRPSISSAHTLIPGHGTSEAYRAPIRSFTPVISPSGAVFYTGALFPQWRGDLLVGGLSSQALIRLVLHGERVALEERIDMKRRIRDVIQTPDGALLVIVDAEKGDLLRLTPAGAPSRQSPR